MSTDTCQDKSANTLSMSWDMAIADTKAKIKQLQESLRFFEKKRRNGEPFPLKQSIDQTSEHQHSV